MDSLPSETKSLDVKTFNIFLSYSRYSAYWIGFIETDNAENSEVDFDKNLKGGVLGKMTWKNSKYEEEKRYFVGGFYKTNPICGVSGIW